MAKADAPDAVETRDGAGEAELSLHPAQRLLGEEVRDDRRLPENHRVVEPRATHLLLNKKPPSVNSCQVEWSNERSTKSASGKCECKR